VTAPAAPGAPGQGVQAVRDALAALKAGTGDYEAVKAAVEQARFATRPTARSVDELAESWDYRPVPDSFTDTVTVARWQKILTPEQHEELKGMARFVSDDPTRLTWDRGNAA
jgi:hypothetical protein